MCFTFIKLDREVNKLGCKLVAESRAILYKSTCHLDSQCLVKFMLRFA